MIRLIFSIVFLIILAVFIAFNAQFSTDVNLFGYKLESVPLVAVVLLTLVAGVLYSFGLYLITYFSKRRVQKEKNKKRKNEEKAKALKTQEHELKTAQASLEKSSDISLPPPEDKQAAIPGRVETGRQTNKNPGVLVSWRRKIGRRGRKA
jgi:uncharacterized integral membrane protein